MSTVTLYPNSDSSPLNLVPVASGSHYARIDESSASDSDYVYRNDTAGSYYYDWYGFGDGSYSGTIQSIIVYARCYGQSNYTPPDGYGVIQCKISGTAYSLGSAFNISSGASYAYYSSGTISANPATGGAWTWATINAMTVGLGLKTGVYGGSSRCSQLYMVVTYTSPPTISSFSASPTSIYPGDSSLLSWGSSGATSASISNIGSVTVSGSTYVSPSSSTTYTLTVYNSGGSASASVTVYIAAPVIVSFSANPTSMVLGSGSLLSWNTTGATSASINQGIGAVSVDGTTTVNPASSTTYTLYATNVSGTVTAGVTVTLLAPTIDSLSATPGNIKFGSKSILSWTTTGAASITIDQGVGAVSADGTRTVQPDDTVKYTLTVSNNSGNATDDVTVTVIPADKVKIEEDITAEISPDYGRLPQMNFGNHYLELSSDLTNHYIESLGYDYPAGDFKRPYLAKDYNSMVYLHNDTPAERSPNLRDVAAGRITGNTPGRDDMYFDFSQQLASVDNFNSYAGENYRLMGKTSPKATYRFSGSIESISSDVGTNIYSGSNAVLTVVSPQYAGDKYSWSGAVKNGSGDWGRLSSNTGLSVTYITPTLTANYRYVTISLMAGGKTLAEIEFVVWYKG